MIFIQSNPYDSTTSLVKKWLDYFKFKSTFLVDSKCFLENEFLLSNNINNNLVSNIGKGNNINENLAYWYRKNIYSKDYVVNFPENFLNTKNLCNNISSELSVLQGYINFILGQAKNGLNTNSIGNLNKLKVLAIASKLGILVPKFIITNNKEILDEFISKNNKVIIKPISEVEIIEKSDGEYLQYTHLLSKRDIKNLPDYFFPSLFQEHINKDFEIRAFILGKEIYSMAMFTQKNEQTSVDFRRYMKENSERWVPYKLPINLHSKLIKLFRKLEINTGSVDLIYYKKKYYFLEVNPVGQFGMVSEPCNYYLEKKIALKLGKKDK